MYKEKTTKLPGFLRPFLWSYDLSRMDTEKHKSIIIKNILDLGSEQATNWLRQQYTKDEIRDAIAYSIRGNWSKKSINLWSFIYDVEPQEARFKK